LDAAAAVSVPYDLEAGVTFLEGSPLGAIYTKYFLDSLKRKVEGKRALLDPVLDLERVMAAETLRAFDDVATAPLHGFQGAKDYYTRSSSGQFLPGIRIPTLLIHARNDPFLPRKAIPQAVMDANPHLTPLVSTGGGHVGFVGGPLPWRPLFWAETRIQEFFRNHLL
jgi:predicted alpha/beta-fold hydrolase